jgi:hypothetical protein
VPKGRHFGLQLLIKKGHALLASSCWKEARELFNHGRTAAMNKWMEEFQSERRKDRRAFRNKKEDAIEQQSVGINKKKERIRITERRVQQVITERRK